MSTCILIWQINSPKPKNNQFSMTKLREKQQILKPVELQSPDFWYFCLKSVSNHQNSCQLISCQPINELITAVLLTLKDINRSSRCFVLLNSISRDYADDPECRIVYTSLYLPSSHGLSSRSPSGSQRFSLQANFLNPKFISDFCGFHRRTHCSLHSGCIQALSC